METQIKVIESLLRDFLGKMTVTAEICVSNGDDCPQFVIKTDEAGILIGENGQNLAAINHIFKKVVEAEFRKAETELIPFLLDVNDYQAKKIEELKNLARMNAQRVRYFKKEIELEPMSSFERRIVHAVLTEYPDISTGSIGEGFDRHVVIKPLSI